MHITSRCHRHSLSLVSVKSRLVLPFWYRLTRIVPDKGPLNGCVYCDQILLIFCRNSRTYRAGFQHPGFPHVVPHCAVREFWFFSSKPCPKPSLSILLQHISCCKYCQLSLTTLRLPTLGTLLTTFVYNMLAMTQSVTGFVCRSSDLL